MSITRLEVAVMAPKTQAVTEIKIPEIQKSIHEQVQIQSEFSKHIKHNNQQAVKLTKSENNEYRYDSKEKGNNKFNNPKKQNKNSQGKETSTKEVKRSLPGTIDIRI